MPSHPVDIHVGKRLRLRRTVFGMSQDELAKSLGITFQQIQKYERGINRIGSSRMFHISQILKTPVSYFFEGLEGMVPDGDTKGSGMAEDNAAFESAELQESMSSRETLELVRAFNSIKRAQVRRKVYELVRSISESELEDA